MRRSEWWPSLLALAEDQGGAFTAAQAQAIGAGRPQLQTLERQGQIERLQHGVYQIGGTPVDRWTPIRAAWLSLSPEESAASRLERDDPEGVVSHRTAALVLGLGDLDADLTEITTSTRRRSRNPEVRFHRGDLARVDWTVRHGLPVTTPLHTLQTLAEDGIDLDHLAACVRDATLRYSITADELAAPLTAAAPRFGAASGSELVDILLDRAAVPQSAVDLATRPIVESIARLVANSSLHTATDKQLAALARQLGTNSSLQKEVTQAVRIATNPIGKQMASLAASTIQPSFAKMMRDIVANNPALQSTSRTATQAALRTNSERRPPRRAIEPTPKPRPVPAPAHQPRAPDEDDAE